MHEVEAIATTATVMALRIFDLVFMDSRLFVCVVCRHRWSKRRAPGPPKRLNNPINPLIHKRLNHIQHDEREASGVCGIADRQCRNGGLKLQSAIGWASGRSAVSHGFLILTFSKCVAAVMQAPASPLFPDYPPWCPPPRSA